MARREECYIGPTVPGIDVSHHQGQIDWDAVASSGVRYVFIRTGDGVNVDRRFAENWAGAGRVGLRRGTYHYFRARHPGAEQARVAAGAIAAAGGFGRDDLAPAIDLENDSLLGEGGRDAPEESFPTLVAGAVEFQREMERLTKRRPMVYSGQFWQRVAIRHPELARALAAYPLWTAGYVRCARVADGFPTWTFWQYTSSGDVPGIQRGVDMNVFKGDESALSSFVRGRRKLAWGWIALGSLAAVGAGYGVYRARGGRKPKWLPV